MQVFFGIPEIVSKYGETRCLITLLQSDGTLRNILFSGTEKTISKSIVFESSYRLNAASPFLEASIVVNEEVSLVTIDSEHQVDFWKRRVGLLKWDYKRVNSLSWNRGYRCEMGIILKLCIPEVPLFVSSRKKVWMCIQQTVVQIAAFHFRKNSILCRR